jgi:hypothetical protein
VAAPLQSVPASNFIVSEGINRWLASLFLGLLVVMAFPARGAGETETLRGQVLTPKRVPIANSVCSLSGRMLPQGGLQTTTGPRGHFSYPGVIAGTYSLTCAALGRQPVSKSNITITPGKQVPPLQFVLPREILVRKHIIVHATSGKVVTTQAAPPTSFSAQNLMTLPLAQLKFKAALPLVPGVVRTSNGELFIKGAPEEQGLLLVDGADLVDPVTGAFSVEVPIDAIEQLQVYKAPYLAQYGRFSGGLTTIDTKPPLDQWHWEVNDIIPDPFIEQGHIQGISGDAPRFYLTGPLIKNKLSFAESFIYDFNRNFIEGLPWPHNLTRQEGWSSFTTFQYIFSPQHLLSVDVRYFPMRHDDWNISALVPQTASSDLGQAGHQIGATDNYLFKSGGILTSLFQDTRFNTYSHGQGSEPMLLTPNGFGGNYFNTYQRFADQQELLEEYGFPKKKWHGDHHIQIGGDFYHRAYHGTSASSPIDTTNTSGQTLETMTFSGLAELSDVDTEFEAYGQDHWLVNNYLGLDYGLRFSSENIGNKDAFAPRFGFVFTPNHTGSTVIRGGGGVFFNREPLLAADYAENPTETIQYYSPQGIPLGAPQFWSNGYSIYARNGRQIIPIHNHLGVTPYDETWSAEVDQELTPNWLLKASYLGNSSLDQFDVNPESFANGTNAYLLSDGGTARYHEFVAATRYHVGERADMNLAYVHSVARGDLNTLSQLYMPFEQPVIRPDFFADLPSDIPNRVITWGEFGFPWGLTVSPVFDIHTGFPYSDYNILQSYSGPPDSHRFPRFYSLDLKVSKDFHIPFIHTAFLRKHKFRGAIGIFDVTNHENPVDVFSNTASPYYGGFIGFQHLTFNTWFDLIY